MVKSIVAMSLDMEVAIKLKSMDNYSKFVNRVLKKELDTIGKEKQIIDEYLRKAKQERMINEG